MNNELEREQSGIYLCIKMKRVNKFYGSIIRVFSGFPGITFTFAGLMQLN
jgi:hypothetical protein